MLTLTKFAVATAGQDNLFVLLDVSLGAFCLDVRT